MRTLPLTLALLTTGLGATVAAIAMQQASLSQAAAVPHCAAQGRMLVANS
ncbi:hypothetical protein [Chitinimonas naiadis]